MAVQNDLILFRGEDYTPSFIMTPLTDISGWTIVLSVKESFDASTTLLSKLATITDGPNGVFQFDLSASNTALEPAVYVYDCWRIDSGSEAVLSTGKFVVKPEVRTIGAIVTPVGPHLEGDVWLEATGTSPSRVVSLKALDNGNEITLASTIY